jgi:hypothetical protein
VGRGKAFMACERHSVIVAAIQPTSPGNVMNITDFYGKIDNNDIESLAVFHHFIIEREML